MSAAVSGLELVRERGFASLPDLASNLLVQARMKAAEALKSAFTLRRDPKRTASMPRSRFSPPRYNQRTYRLDWASSTVSLTLISRPTACGWPKGRDPEQLELSSGFERCLSYDPQIHANFHK